VRWLCGPQTTRKLGLKVYGPKPCEAKLRARAAIAGMLEDVSPDPNVQVMPVAGAKTGEPASS
jgi:hypothetical protein